MITPPENWDTIYGEPGSIVEFRVVVDLVADIQAIFTESKVSSSGFTFEKRLFDKWSVGNAMSAHLSFTAIDAAAEIPIMTEGQRCTFECRAVSGEDSTDWVQLGIFYVDSIDVNGDSASVSAFDGMTRLERETPVFNEDITLGDYAALLESTSGISLLVDSPLLDAEYLKVGERTSSQSKPPTTHETLDTLTIPATLSGENARNIIASAAALAGGNAIIDSNEVLQFVALDATSMNYNPGTIPIYCGSEKRYLDAIRFSQFFIANKTEMASGLGYGIAANVIDKLLIDDEYSMYSWNTAELIYGIVFTGRTVFFIEDSATTVDNAEITPLIELRDQVSYSDVNGKAQTFRINGFRLNCAGWSVGELSTQINAQDVEIKTISAYSWLTGWRVAAWYKHTIAVGRVLSVGNGNNIVIESEKSFLIHANAFNPSNRYVSGYQCRATRFIGQQFRFHISLAYIHGSTITDRDITCYAFPCVYEMANNTTPGYSGNGTSYTWVRFVCDDFPTDISLTSPFSATLYCDTETYYEGLEYVLASNPAN